MKTKSADGLTGHIFPSYTGGHSTFRVYSDEDNTFTDYLICHSDLMVTICDPDAYIYETDGICATLDHSPDTLGIDSN